MLTKLMYASISATGDNAATLDISAVGSTGLMAVLWAVSFDSITDNGRIEAQLSRAVASQVATNNVNDVISLFSANSNFVTSGLSLGTVSLWHPVGLTFKREDRIAIHATISGTVVARIHLLLYWR